MIKEINILHILNKENLRINLMWEVWMLGGLEVWMQGSALSYER